MGEAANVMTPCDSNSPLMQAWKLYRKSSEYENSASWARLEQHTEGSLWAAFERGWRERQRVEANASSSKRGGR